VVHAVPIVTSVEQRGNGGSQAEDRDRIPWHSNRCSALLCLITSLHVAFATATSMESLAFPVLFS
jgi:hypothetical protein